MVKWKGFGRKRTWPNYRHYACKPVAVLRKTGIVGVPPEVRTCHVLNTI